MTGFPSFGVNGLEKLVPQKNLRSKPKDYVSSWFRILFDPSAWGLIYATMLDAILATNASMVLV
jgi:hypothetical protein